MSRDFKVALLNNDDFIWIRLKAILSPNLTRISNPRQILPLILRGPLFFTKTNQRLKSR